MMPGNPAFGATVLRIPAEQSPNFVTGVSGWIIRQDGSAEFNNVTIRGGEIVGGDSLFYSPSEGAGNLVLSVNGDTADTADSFGNVVFPGVTVYKGSGGIFRATQFFGSLVTEYTAASQAGPYSILAGIELASAEGITLQDLSGNGITLDTSGGPIVIGPSGAATVSIDSPLTTDQATIGAALTATSGTSASPTVITTDTWHNVTPPTGFTGLLRYRLRAENDVEVQAQMAVGTTAGTGVITLITLPAAYTPAQTQRGPCGVFTNGIPSSGAGVQGILNLRWSADPAGTFTLRAFPGGLANTGITECSFNIRYALD